MPYRTLAVRLERPRIWFVHVDQGCARRVFGSSFIGPFRSRWRAWWWIWRWTYWNSAESAYAIRRGEAPHGMVKP